MASFDCSSRVVSAWSGQSGSPEVLYELPYSIREALLGLAVIAAGWALYLWVGWLAAC